MNRMLHFALVFAYLGSCGLAVGGDDPSAGRLIGYTELRTNLPGGRHANNRTMRATLVDLDGRERRRVAEELADLPDAWTQFAGWSPDGRQAIVIRGWESPENAAWEEEHKEFRFTREGWLLDSHLVELETGRARNVTGVDRVSHYNGGLFYLPGGRSLGFTPLIDGVSRPYVMDLDGKNKRAVSGEKGGFAYGYSASPDGKLVSFHEDYQVVIVEADGSGKRRIETGNPFNFGPTWSPDSQWLLFLSGVHGRSDPYVVRRDGSGLRKLMDLGDYQSWVPFLDVPDFHNGSSDLPVWSSDGRSVYLTAKVGTNVELFHVKLDDGSASRLTTSPTGTWHYHPQPSDDGRWLAYGSLRHGRRELYVRHLTDGRETKLTELKPGQAAMWPHWRPTKLAVTERAK